MTMPVHHPQRCFVKWKERASGSHCEEMTLEEGCRLAEILNRDPKRFGLSQLAQVSPIDEENYRTGASTPMRHPPPEYTGEW